MYLRSNEINFNKIHDKFDRFCNDTNVLKIRIVNEMKSNKILFNLNLNLN